MWILLTELYQHLDHVLSLLELLTGLSILELFHLEFLLDLTLFRGLAFLSLFFLFLNFYLFESLLLKSDLLIDVSFNL